MKDLSYEELLEQDISILEQEISILEGEVREAREEKNKLKISRLERKEKIEQEISRLEQEIFRMAYECGDKKWMRIKRTFFVITGAIYSIELFYALKYGIGDIGDISIDIICGLLFAPLVAAGFIMVLAWAVLSYIVTGAMEDEKAVHRLMGRLDEAKSNAFNKE